MTRKAVQTILATLAVAYPHAYSKTSDADAEPMVKLWMRQFEGFDGPEVGAAVDALIATRKEGYAPTIGEIKDQVLKIRQREDLSETEAWALVAKACANGIYGYKTEFDKLPEEVQRAVGRPEQLRDWAMISTEELQTVVASNFMRGFNARRKRDREDAILPPAVRQFIGGVADKMLLPEQQKADKHIGENQ